MTTKVSDPFVTARSCVAFQAECGELDFIINYDIKYRMGTGPEEQED